MPDDLQQLLGMLERAGIGHGKRIDHNPPGTSVQVEADDGDGGWVSVDFSFDESGTLKGVAAYPGEEG